MTLSLFKRTLIVELHFSHFTTNSWIQRLAFLNSFLNTVFNFNLPILVQYSPMLTNHDGVVWMEAILKTFEVMMALGIRTEVWRMMRPSWICGRRKIIFITEKSVIFFFCAFKNLKYYTSWEWCYVFSGKESGTADKAFFSSSMCFLIWEKDWNGSCIKRENRGERIKKNVE